MSFKTIETQEELDKIIESRLARQKETLEKQFADYDEIKTRKTELETENANLQTSLQETAEKSKEYDQKINDLNTKVSGYETASLRTKIALSAGLPFDLADRLQGDDEDSLTKDAERLSGFIKSGAPVPPMKTQEPSGVNSKDAAYRGLLEGLENEGE